MENKNNNSHFMQTISIFDICKLLLSKWYWIVLGGVLIMSAMGIYTKYMVEPTYNAYTTLYVFNRSETNGIGDISSGDITASADLAEAYKVLLNSKSLREAVIKEIKNDKEYSMMNISAGYLGSVVSVSNVDETQVIKISVKTTDAKLSAKIANAYAFVSPNHMTKITEVGKVNVVDYAEAPAAPSAPSMSKNCILGFAIGAMLVIAFFVIKYVLDTVLRSVEDIENATDVAVIGNIPAFKVGEASKQAVITVVKARSISNE